MTVDGHVPGLIGGWAAVSAAAHGRRHLWQAWNVRKALEHVRAQSLSEKRLRTITGV